MALASAVVGGVRPQQIVTWLRSDADFLYSTDQPEDLRGATLSGRMRNVYTGEARAIVGALVLWPALYDQELYGQFRWAYDAADLVAGLYEVQFMAAFVANPTPAVTIPEYWEVFEAL